MYESTKQPTFTRDFLSELLASLVTLPGSALLPSWNVRLFTAGPTPITPNSAFGDFTQATFDGYLSETVTPSTAHVTTPSGDAIAAIGDATYICDNNTTPETILGYYISNGSTILYFAEYFPAPIPITQAGDFISINLALAIAFSPLVEL